MTEDKDLVLEQNPMGQLFGYGPEIPLVNAYESHPIVNDLKGSFTGFPVSRSLEVKNGDKTTVEKLFSTSDNSFATTNLNSPEIKPSKSDKKGPLVLGAAGTYNSSKGNGNGRFIVVGSSTWVSNFMLPFNGNRDLYLNMLNWLSSDEDLISIRPKAPEDRRLNMTQRQVSMVFYASVVMIPLLIVVSGVGVWWRRR